MKIVDTVKELIKDTVTELGYVLYDVDFVKEPEGYILTVYIDPKPNDADKKITIDDCERVSRAIDPILDEKDPIPQSYFLSVSSVGIDRPIKTDADFARNIGVMVDVKLYAPVDKKKAFCGVLKEYDGINFTITDANGKDMVIPRKSAGMIRPHIDFN